MGPRYRELLKDIFDRRELADDFSLYLHRPTATDQSFAPEGCDSFYVLCPVPNLLGNVDWEVEGPRLRDRIVNALDATNMPGLKDSITADFWMTPEDFKSRYRAMHGTGFSIAPVFSQSAWFRYHNRDPQIPNLYFAAAGAIPVQGCLACYVLLKWLRPLWPKMKDSTAPPEKVVRAACRNIVGGMTDAGPQPDRC